MEIVQESEKVPLYIHCQTKYVDVNRHLASNMFPLGFTKTYTVEQKDVELSYDEVDGTPVFSVKVMFSYKVGTRLADSFNEVLKDNKGTININQIAQPKIRAFVDREYATWQTSKDIIESVFWLNKLEAKPGAEDIKWSFDKYNWYIFHGLYILGIEVTDTFNFNEGLIDYIVNDTVVEPLEFSLYREGEMLISENPRSGFIMLSQSLEIGAKRFLRDSGDARYADIFENRELPSIESLIVDDIFSQMLKIKLTEQSLELITQIFGERNTIVHQGKFIRKKKTSSDPVLEHTFILDKLGEKRRLIRNILYYLALRSGHDWVKVGYHFQLNFLAN
jgi:hypothetical protein